MRFSHIALRIVWSACGAGALGACSLPREGSAPAVGDPDAMAAPEAGLVVDSSVGDERLVSPAPDADAAGSVDGPSPMTDAAGFLDAPPPTTDAGDPSLCATAGLLFCDGFENGPSAWTPIVTGGTVAIDGSRAFRGAYSFHSRTNAVPGQNLPQLYAHYDHTFAQALPLPLFVRMFVYLPSPVPPSVGAFVNVVENASPFPGVQLNFRPPTGFLGGSGYNGLDTDWYSTTDLLPADSWACIEMEVDGPPSNVVHVFLSGAELPAMQHTLPSSVPPLAILRVGLGYYQAAAQPQSDLWIDEVAVDGAPIGCAR